MSKSKNFNVQNAYDSVVKMYDKLEELDAFIDRAHTVNEIYIDELEAVDFGYLAKKIQMARMTLEDLFGELQNIARKTGRPIIQP